MFLRKFMQNCITRGVALYVKKCITSNQVELANAAKDTIWVEITLEKEKKNDYWRYL